jgi:hypothetical protein
MPRSRTFKELVEHHIEEVGREVYEAAEDTLDDETKTGPQRESDRLPADVKLNIIPAPNK